MILVAPLFVFFHPFGGGVVFPQMSRIARQAMSQANGERRRGIRDLGWPSCVVGRRKFGTRLAAAGAA